MTNDFWESIKFIFLSGEARETNFTADDFRMNVNRLVYLDPENNGNLNCRRRKTESESHQF